MLLEVYNNEATERKVKCESGSDEFVNLIFSGTRKS